MALVSNLRLKMSQVLKPMGPMPCPWPLATLKRATHLSQYISTFWCRQLELAERLSGSCALSHSTNVCFSQTPPLESAGEKHIFSASEAYISRTKGMTVRKISGNSFQPDHGPGGGPPAPPRVAADGPLKVKYMAQIVPTSCQEQCS